MREVLSWRIKVLTMSRVFLDLRVPQGGVGRYGRELYQAMTSLPGSPTFTLHEATSAWDAPFTPWGRRRAANLAREWGADVFHGMHFELPRSHLPMVVTIQDLIPLTFPASMPNPLRRMAFRRIVSSAIAHAERILVTSDASRDEIVAFGARPEVIRVIPLGVSDLFKPLNEQERREARSRFAAGERYVASIYSPRPHKNFGVLVEAARLVPGVRFVAAGAIGSAEGISYTGHLSDTDLRLFYGGAEVFVLPSLIEGFGLPLVEALACGTPVVCGEGVRALSYIGGGAAVVDVGSGRAIASAVDEILNDDNLHESHTRRAVKGSSSLRIVQTAKKTIDVYKELVPR